MKLLGTTTHAAAGTVDLDLVTEGEAGQFQLDITAIAGTTPSTTFSVLGVNRLNGTTWAILTSTAKNATGQTMLTIHHNLTASANVIAKDILPRHIKIRSVLTGTTPTATIKVYGNTYGPV